MTDTQINERAVLDARLAWFLGGSLLLASVLVSYLILLPLPGGRTIATALFSVALLVFAFGIRGSGSVTSRRPLGTTALAALGAWVLVGSVLQDVISSNYSNDSPPGTLLAFGYVDSFVRFALALIAVIQIGRTGTVPAPWNWGPAWIVGAISALWLVQAIIFSVPASQNALPLITAFTAADNFVRTGGQMLLGVVAILLADRTGRSVAVAVAEEGNAVTEEGNSR